MYKFMVSLAENILGDNVNCFLPFE